MSEEFFAGIRCLFRGFGFLTRAGLKRYVAIPLLINSVLFMAAIVYAVDRVDAWLRYVSAGLPVWLTWIFPLLWLLFAATTALALFYGFTLVVNLIGAPFNSFLSAHVELLATGHAPHSSRGLWQDIVISLRDEVRRLVYVLWRTLLVGLLGLLLLFVPLLNMVVPLLWFLFTAWMLAIQYSDYPLSNHGVAFAAQRLLLRARRARLLGFGAATALCTLIPVVNFMVMPAAVAGVTLLWSEAGRRGPPSATPG